jgi:hypothetical protein
MRLKAFAFAVALALSGVFFIDVCALVFGCGCHSLWAGAAIACDVHNPEPPHCPWCAHLSAGAVAFLAPALAQGFLLFGPGRAGVGLRFLLALAVFPVIAGLVGGLQRLLWM